MPKTSIQRRLIAAVVISQLLLAAGVFVVAVYFAHGQLRAGFDEALQGRAMTILALVRYSEDEHPKLQFEDDLVPPPLYPQHHDLYQVIGPDGKLLAQSPTWPEDFSFPTDNRDTSHADFIAEGTRYRAVRLRNIPVLDREGDKPATDTVQIIYASPIAPMARAVGHLRQYIAAGCAILLCITVPLAVWGLRRGLRPLANLAANAASISTSNWQLNPADEALSTRELAPLTTAMTSMLDGLHRAFMQQREFLANAAHELKTPVAILKSTLQSLLQRPRSSEEYRAGLEEALDDMARLEKLLHSMLRLARAEQWASGSLHRDLPQIDVRATCQSACERLQSVARERGVHIDLSNDGPMPMRADPEDLELVWTNLLENAIRFSPHGGTVQINASARGRSGNVEVADHGPGIPVEELPHIFERFHRGDESRARNTGGYGLGLAIAKALVEAYDGTITPKTGVPEGTRMIVTFPLQG
jgi:signal transduction histidine kinase